MVKTTSIRLANTAVNKNAIKLTAVKKRVLKKELENLSAQLAEIKQESDLAAKAINPDLKKMMTSLDNMSEMGEMESLRLQMAMDRMSKMMTMLSNIMRKMNDTQKNIMGNIK